jgi:CBS domain-containing protein
MTPADRVVSVRPGTGYKDIARLLTEHQISAMPVLGEADRVIGVVSEADLIAKESRAQPTALTPGEARARHKAQAAIGAELMTSPPVTITADADVSEAARTLERRGVKRLPVVDEQGRLAGIVSRRDILRIFLRGDEELREDVLDLLVGSFWISPEGWTVEVRDGVVRLAGQMESRSTARIAEQAVRRIDGVVAIDSELTYAVDDTKFTAAGDYPYGGVFSGRYRGHRRGN